MVGINTIKMMSGEDTIEGLGFAIPTSLAVRWVNEMIEFGEIQPQPGAGPDDQPDSRDVCLTAAGACGLKKLPQVSAAIRQGSWWETISSSFAGQEVSSTSEILALRRDLHVGDLVHVRAGATASTWS